MRRPLALALAFAVVAGVVGSASARRYAPAGPNATFVVTGHGWGHGVGMSQYGAYGYAQHGFGYAKILAHYFPGTTLGPASVSRVRVLLAAGGPAPPPPAWEVKGTGGDRRGPLRPPLLPQPGGSPLQLGRRYRVVV